MRAHAYAHAGQKCRHTDKKNNRLILYCAKDPLPKEASTHVVYSVKCKTCKDEYVGETKRALSVRKKDVTHFA